MNTDLNTLVNTLREIAYDAGCALLFPVDSETTRCYAGRYNRAFRQLCELAPRVSETVTLLPDDANAVSIRIAARAAATQAKRNLTNCFHRLAA